MTTTPSTAGVSALLLYILLDNPPPNCPRGTRRAYPHTMRDDLTPMDRLRASALLRAVIQAGTLRGGAKLMGVPLRTAQYWWRAWGLADDRPLRRGRPPKRGSSPDSQGSA